MDSYLAVCPQGRVVVRNDRVVVGPCVPKVSIFYTLGVTPLRTVSPSGQAFFVPRVNTFRPDGQFVLFFNQAGAFSVDIPISICGTSASTGSYGVDVFAFTPQLVTITSVPVVPIAVTSEQSGTQKRHQLIFTTDAAVYVNVGADPNGRLVTFSVDMAAPIAAGTHLTSDWVEVRGSFNDFGGGDIYRLTRTNNIYSGTFPIMGAAGLSVTYKFYGQGITWETIADRTLLLGAVQTPQTVPQVVWNL